MLMLTLVDGKQFSVIEAELEAFNNSLTSIELTVLLETEKEKLKKHPLIFFRLYADQGSIDEKKLMEYIDSLEDLGSGCFPFKDVMVVDKTFLKSLYHKFYHYGNFIENDFFLPFNYKPEEKDWKFTSTLSHKIIERFNEMYKQYFN